MLNIILFDGAAHLRLRPLTWTRPVAHLRLGILTLAEKWERYLPADSVLSYQTASHLAAKFPKQLATENLFINAALLPNAPLADRLAKLELGESIADANGELLALRVGKAAAATFDPLTFQTTNSLLLADFEARILRRTWELFGMNDRELTSDFELLTQGRTSQPISETNRILGDANRIFLEEGASAEGAILNAKTGPIYLGKGAEIMEGAMVRGGLAMLEGSVLKLGAKIYGATTIGPHSKVGGEVNNSILMGYCGKAHDGFLGNSVLGEWCNWGADTNNSNLKNNYADVKMWDYETHQFINSRLQFCGLVMGDHSKSGINSMFNTGSTVGIHCNLFGGGLPDTFVPSFSWGGAAGLQTYRIDKAFETAARVMARRNRTLEQAEMDIFQRVFEETAAFRKA